MPFTRVPTEAEAFARGPDGIEDEAAEVALSARLTAAETALGATQTALGIVENGIFGTVNVRVHGAFGLGLTDETAQIQAGIDAGQGGIVVIPDGTYLLSRLTFRSDTRYLLTPNAILKPQSNQSAILFDSPTGRVPSAGAQKQITVDTVVGALTVTVSTTDAATFAAGDAVTLRDSTYLLGGENVRRERNTVESVDTGTGVITLRHPIGHVYAAANDAWIAKITPAQNIHVYGGKIDMDAVAGGIAADCDAIEAQWPENCTVNDLTVYNHPDKGVAFYGGLNSHIRRCNAYSPDLVTGGEGYCAQLEYCRLSTIEGGESQNVRHHGDLVGGQNSGIIGGSTSGRTTDDQVGAFLHGMESRWCYIRGFTAENIDCAAAAGNGTFGADYDCEIADVTAVACDRHSFLAQGSTGRIIRPKSRNQQAAVESAVEVFSDDAAVIDPDIDMGTLAIPGIDAQALNSGGKVTVEGGVVRMNNNTGTVTGIKITGPAGSTIGVDGTRVEGTMVRGVHCSGAATDQTYRRIKFVGTIGEQLRIGGNAAQFRVMACEFTSGTAVRSAVDSGAGPAKVILSGNDFSLATTRFVNSSAAILVGTTKAETEGTVAPTAGTWAVGDRCWKTDVAAAGIPGWVCTTAGTPGTWKAMAAVAA